MSTVTIRVVRVLVTGSNGHLGFALVQALVNDGREVRAGVRVLDGVHTERLAALGDDVEIVAADLGAPDQLEAALDGVHTLFHTAAVYDLTSRKRRREMLDASVRGIEATFRAAAEAGVSRVVLTSSTVTLPQVPPGSPPVTEQDWRTDLRVPYLQAKTEGERLAWSLAGQLELDLVTVLPSALIGPGFRRNTPTVDVIEAAVAGGLRMGAPRGNLAFVDVRDAAQAHVLAAWADVNGRFIVSDAELSFRELAETLRTVDPAIKVPARELPAAAWPVLPLVDRLNSMVLRTPRTVTRQGAASMVSGKLWHVSSDRARDELGWVPQYSVEESLRDTVATLRANREGSALAGQPH